jgi:hypothetical protein
MRHRPRRFRRPAPGQMVFWFVVSPVPTYWTPSEAPQCFKPRKRSNVPSFRRWRAGGDPRPSGNRVDWQVNRWVERGAACVLCNHWPASCDHLVRGRIMLVCRTCEARADTRVRLEEIALVDWRETPERLAQPGRIRH